MRTYPEYKDSGVEWIGEIPKGWEIKKLKFLVDKKGFIRGPFGGSLKVEEFVSSGFKVYEQKNAIYEDIEIGDSYVDEEKFREMERFSVKYKDFIFSCSGTIGRSYLVPENFEPGIINQALLIIRFSKENRIVHNFISIIFKGFGFQEQVIDNSQGGAMKNLVGVDKFKNIKIPVPPTSEQKQISDYLDRKTQQIDDLIEKTELKIELLKEQRSSLINQCVTKGLDPNVQMKDSGVEWIGEIPKGWKITKSKFISTFINGYSFKSDNWKETGIPVIRMSNIGVDGKLKITEKNLRFVDETTFELAKNFQIKKGDILICMTDMNPKMLWLGSTVRFNEEEKYLLNQRVGITRINDAEVDIVFYSYLSNTSFVKDQLKTSVYPNVQTNLSVDPIRNSILLLPPLSEQKHISEHLDKETSKIDQMVDTETKRIDLLKEYRQSLISNVVTGKIDVRDEVVQ